MLHGPLYSGAENPKTIRINLQSDNPTESAAAAEITMRTNVVVCYHSPVFCLLILSYRNIIIMLLQSTSFRR